MAALAVGSIVAAGCDDCDEGATRCWYNIVQHCGSRDSPSIRWLTDEVCSSSQTCFTPPGMTPMCVLSTDPDPLCADDAFSYCGEDTLVRCMFGYGIESQPCGASPNDPAFSKCVDAFPGDAVCVPPEAIPNDVCAPAGTSDAASPSQLCADTLDVTCLAGLAIATRACAVCDQQCFGFLGDACGSDGECATGLTCQPDSQSNSRCTAACDATDPNAVQHCEDLYTAGGPPPSLSSIPPGNSQMTCTAGFCEWVN
jgi:hypothetical protein